MQLGIKGERVMKDQDDDKGQNISGISGLEIKCNRCGQELPLLHPHIMLERNDEQGNLICDECYDAEDFD